MWIILESSHKSSVSKSNRWIGSTKRAVRSIENSKQAQSRRLSGLNERRANFKTNLVWEGRKLSPFWKSNPTRTTFIKKSNTYASNSPIKPVRLQKSECSSNNPRRKLFTFNRNFTEPESRTKSWKEVSTTTKDKPVHCIRNLKIYKKQMANIEIPTDAIEKHSKMKRKRKWRH